MRTPAMDFNATESEKVVEFFRAYLKQVVSVHQTMFEKLLFEQPEICLEVGELFEDTGNAYLAISELISEKYLTNKRFEINEKV